MKRTIGEIMTRDVVTAPVDARVRDVAREMAKRRISCVVIVADDKPIGIISERDIVRIVAERPNMLVGLLASEAMTTPVITLRTDAILSETLREMKDRHHRRFPIVDERGKLIGLVTQTTILHALSD